MQRRLNGAAATRLTAIRLSGRSPEKGHKRKAYTGDFEGLVGKRCRLLAIQLKVTSLPSAARLTFETTEEDVDPRQATMPLRGSDVWHGSLP